MPATMSQLLGDRARVTITGANGFSIFVEYRPQFITPRSTRAELHRLAAAASTAALADMETAAESGNADAAIQAAETALDETERAVTHKLAAVLLGWDLLDDDGEIVPPTLDGLMGVDIRLQRRILDAIEQDNVVGEANGAKPSTPSASRSSRKARRATSRR